MNLHKENIREIKSLIKEYGLVTFGSAVYDLYSEGNLVLPERLSRQVEEVEPDKPDFTDWGGQIIKAVGSGELTFTEDELNTIWSFCENPSWMYNRKGKRINEMRKRIRLNEAQLKQIIKEAVQKTIDAAKPGKFAVLYGSGDYDDADDYAGMDIYGTFSTYQKACAGIKECYSEVIKKLKNNGYNISEMTECHEEEFSIHYYLDDEYDDYEVHGIIENTSIVLKRRGDLENYGIEDLDN